MSFEPPVGMIGTGLMGEVFARRLAGAGFGVVGFDIDPAKAARLSEFGAHPAASIADVVRAARVIVLAVFNTDQVEQTLVNDYFGMTRLEWDNEVDFQLPYGEWLRLFRRSGFVVEDLIEIQPPVGATSTYRNAAVPALFPAVVIVW